MEQSEETIFHEALALDTVEAREEFLAVACAGQPELLQSVRSLLDAYSQNAFLDHTMLPEEFARSIASANAKRMDATVGPYHILKQIGHGGMGSVYMAEQLHPVRRMVAIKVIRQGLDSRDVVRRFHQEQRTLAMMDHPNIARVLDASITESGVSYFVMELVNGIPILAFCEEHSLDVEQRLRLFIDCCQAIQHAHQKGIIHRDIKPSNVMVTLQDGQPVVKVIDFGIAKAFATDNPGSMRSGNTFATQLGEFLGTPQYMSPEQAAMDGVPLDTRTDIYSLGALLYAILTGGPPFDSTRLRQATFDEIRQIVREKDPLRPSVQIRARAAAQDTAGNSGLSSTLRRLSQRLSGDLDCIVMKALEKDRERRYSTVNDLAEDIQSFLDNKPIHARAPTAIYTLRKLTQRHRSLVLVGTVSSVLCLLVGIAAALVQANRASKAEAVANRERDAAVDARETMAETLYASDLRLASAATIDRDTVTANDALTRHVPKPGEPDRRSFDWHFLAARNSIKTQELFRSDKALYAMCRICGGSQIACCGMDGTIWIFDELNGKLLHTIHAEQGEVNGLASSPDGTILASAGDDGTIAFWDVATGAAKDRFLAHTRQAFQVGFSVDGQRIATCGNEPGVRIWTVADRGLLCEIPSGGHDLECLAVSINDDLAFGAEGGLVTLTRMPTTAGEVPHLRTMSDVSTDHCGAVAFSLDGRFLAAGRFNGKVIVDAVDLEVTHLREEFLLSDAVKSLTFSADGRSIGAGARDGTVSLLNLRVGEENGYRLSAHDLINDLAGTSLDGDDGVVMPPSPTVNSEIVTLTLPESRPGLNTGTAAHNRIESWPLHAGSSACVLFSQNGDGVLSVGADGRCRRVADQNLASVKFVSNSAEQLQFDCQSRLLVTLTISEEAFYARESLPEGSVVRQTDEKLRLAILRPTISKTGTVYSAIVGPDRNKAILRWSHDLQNSEVVWRAATDEHMAMYAVSPDEQFLAVQTVKFRDGRHAEQFGMTIWDLKRQKEVSRDACERAYKVVFFPDGKSVAYSKRDGVVLFEPLSGRTLRFLPVAAFAEFAISPDGQELATVSDDRMLRIWRTEDGAELHCIKAHGVSANSVAWTTDGRTLGTVGMDGLFRCWRRDVMQMTMEVPFPTQLVFLEFSPDGKKAAILDGQHRAFLLTTAESTTAADVGKN